MLQKLWVDTLCGPYSILLEIQKAGRCAMMRMNGQPLHVGQIDSVNGVHLQDELYLLILFDQPWAFALVFWTVVAVRLLREANGA
ncbi:MAG: hypothetical protein F4213_12230 [Boseongicola sp. SB0677_bin_26]|nr:hypothetical protein [Boseongicola sp. SB0665_bin_10]MYG26771.1 hypothetical protein [Boseongicola sp. SB0677_bin_26]